MWPDYGYPSSFGYGYDRSDYGYDRYVHASWTYIPDPPSKSKKPTTTITINKEHNPMTTVAQQRKAHAADIQLITEKMRDLAAEHDFCSTFTQAVEDLNKDLNMPIVLNKRGKGDLQLSIYVRFTDVGLDSGDDLDDQHFELLITKITEAIEDANSEYDAKVERNGVSVDYESFEVR